MTAGGEGEDTHHPYITPYFTPYSTPYMTAGGEGEGSHRGKQQAAPYRERAGARQADQEHSQGGRQPGGGQGRRGAGRALH